MSTSARGNSAENFVATALEEMGYTVASRRHRKGGGDLMAVWGRWDALPPMEACILVEVKARPRATLYSGSGFSLAQRDEMRTTPMPPLSGLWCARVQGSGKKRSIEWIHEDDWPGSVALKEAIAA